MGGNSESLVVRFVRDRDAHCPHCGYNVRNVTRAICTECGAPLVLKVGIGMPAIGRLIACLMPMIAYCGFAIWLWLPVGAALLFPRLRSGLPPIVYVLALLGLVEVVVILQLYRSRMRFLALPRTGQTVIAALIWVFHAGLTCVFLLGPP